MHFLNRVEELARLTRLMESGNAALAVLHGRRRVGKTRLLLEWSSSSDGLYTVADQSAPEIQRRYFADAVAARLPGFSDVAYPDWTSLLARLARDAEASGWRGPVVIDELPYLATASSEIASVLQRWIDHEARRARLVVAVAGSSQRMMQGLVLSANAPLYGRASELLDLPPLDPSHLVEAFAPASASEWVELYTAWGGIPRYWELAREVSGGVHEELEHLVLNPLGPLHREPDRLLLEDLPPAVETRPVLDAIGAGAHRVSEIASRIGRPATSMSRPLERLVSMGLVRREVPFGESERTSRRSLYKIDDPFFRLWFRVVAPHRGLLASAPPRTRAGLLRKHWSGLAAQAWEELCRSRVTRLSDMPLGVRGPWGPASRWWHGNAPEWDVVSQSSEGDALLVGEARWSPRPLGGSELKKSLAELIARPLPTLPPSIPAGRIVRALFVPALENEAGVVVTGRSDAVVVTAGDLMGIT